jgi:NitT/TauT family transport system substrate-binding protein
MMKRTSFVASAIAAVTAAPAFAQTPAPLSVHCSGTGADDAATLLYAQKAGLFRAAGFETTYERSNSGSATVAAVVGGAVDIGKSSMGSLIAARAHNVDIKIHAGGALFGPHDNGDVMLVVLPNAPTKDGKDLNGKTISVPSLGDQNTLAVKAWVDTHGGDSRTLQFTEIPSSAAAAAVAQGRVAAAALVPPFVAHAVSDGVVKVLANVFTAIAPRFLETAWFTTGAYASKNRDLVLHFGKAIGTAAAYNNAHPSETADLLATFTGVSAASILQTGISFNATSLNPGDIQPLIDAMAKYALIDHRFSAADFFFK